MREHGFIIAPEARQRMLNDLTLEYYYERRLRCLATLTCGSRGASPDISYAPEIVSGSDP